MTDNSTSTLDNEQIKIAVNLFRYTMWANSMMDKFEKVLVRDHSKIKKQMKENQFVFDEKLLESEMYHCLWFGILYIVIEGWPRLRIRNEPITKLLRSPNKKLLKNFRDATFHPEDYDDERILDMMSVGQSSIDWAREVTIEFKKFFQNILLG